jgi:hypothetical protein
VQKTEHYDMRDHIGNIHSLFPDIRFNPLETSMDAIMPGNVVSFRTDPNDPGTIVSISATTNYSTRYGRIVEFRTEGHMHSFLMEFENGRTAWFNMPDDVLVRRAGRPVLAGTIQPGDWARILVNQAIIAPGHVMESVRGMELEGDARHISSIVRGRLTGFNVIQNQIMIQDSQTLERAGWVNHQRVAQYNISGPHVEYFLDGRPVSLSFVQNTLRFAQAEVYIAMENHHGGERVRMVSFRTGRDELLAPDLVLGIDGQGGFHVVGNDGVIGTDAGTIVRRNGRLVDGRNIMPWDYATVVLSGGNSAAVVDIGPMPATAGVTIARGRIQSVDQGVSFRVQSMALFDGLRWHFTPIQREFAIDHNTIFLGPDGLTNINDFIDFTEDSVFDQVFNIVIDGSRAARVIDAPYTTQAVRGIIYAIDGDEISIRNVHTHNLHTNRWTLTSQINATAFVTVGPNSIIVDRNEVVGLNNLRIGDQIRVMTTPIASPSAGMEFDGYIVLVER